MKHAAAAFHLCDLQYSAAVSMFFFCVIPDQRIGMNSLYEYESSLVYRFVSVIPSREEFECCEVPEGLRRCHEQP